MMLRKQTVWLLTMLAVMVVLSGYYMVKDPQEQIPALGEEQKEATPFNGVEVTTDQTTQPLETATPAEANTNADTNTDTTTTLEPSSSATDYFQGYKLKREAMTQQQKDEQMSIMSSSDASPQAIAEARAKHDELSQMETQTLALEELIKAKGYKDTVVYAQTDSVNVIVQKASLEPKEVVEIIAMVKQHMKVPGNNVTVRFKQ